MKVKVENTAACRKVVQVEIPSEGVMDEYSDVLNAYMKGAKLPGFRKGKAPKDIVETKYKKEISEDAKERLVPRYYKEALDHQKIEPVAVVGVHDVSFAKEDGLAFKVTVDVAPEFKLPKYKKITLKGEKVEVEDSEIEEAYNRFLQTFARFEDTDRKVVQKEDLIKVDYSGTCEGKPVSEVGPDCDSIAEGKDFWVFIAENEFLPGFSDALTGSALNEEKKVNIHFPDDYRITSIAGKDAEYTVIVNGIREKALPEMTKEFLKQFEVSSEHELREKIKKELWDNAERNEDNRLRQEISKFLLEKTNIEPPQSIVEQETNLMARNLVERIAAQGATREQIEEQRDDILNTASQSSMERVKLSYILGEIAQKEEIKVEEDEIKDRIELVAQQNRMPAPKLKSELEKRGGLDRLENEIRSEKTLGFLLENSKIKK